MPNTTRPRHTATELIHGADERDGYHFYCIFVSNNLPRNPPPPPIQRFEKETTTKKEGSFLINLGSRAKIKLFSGILIRAKT